MSEPASEIFTVAGAAEYLRADRHTVADWIKAGELAASNIASRTSARPIYRITREAIDDFLRKRAVGPPVKAIRMTRRVAPVVREYV